MPELTCGECGFVLEKLVPNDHPQHYAARCDNGTCPNPALVYMDKRLFRADRYFAWMKEDKS